MLKGIKAKKGGLKTVRYLIRDRRPRQLTGGKGAIAGCRVLITEDWSY